MFLCHSSHGMMSLDYHEYQVLLFFFMVDICVLLHCECASISTGNWKHGALKKLPTPQISASGFVSKTSPQPTLTWKDGYTRSHPSYQWVPHISHRQDEDVTTQLRRSHRTVQDYLDPIGFVGAVSKDIPSPVNTHSHVKNIVPHNNVGVKLLHSSDQSITKQQRYPDVMCPRNLWATAAQPNVQGTAVNEIPQDVKETQTYDVPMLNKAVELSETPADSSLHNGVEITESSQGVRHLDSRDVSTVSKSNQSLLNAQVHSMNNIDSKSDSDKKETVSSATLLLESNDKINPLDTTLEEHVFYTSMNLSPDDIFTLCNLLPPTLHPFPYDLFPHHLSAFAAIDESLDEAEEIMFYEEESRPSANSKILSNKTIIEDNKDILFNYQQSETVKSSDENELLNNSTIYIYDSIPFDQELVILVHDHNDPLNNNTSNPNTSTKQSPFDQLQISYDYKDIFPISFNESEHLNSSNEYVTFSYSGDYDSDYFLNGYEDDYTNYMTAENGNIANYTENYFDSKLFLLEQNLDNINDEINFNHEEFNVNHKIGKNYSEDSIKPLQYTDRREQIIGILSQLNLLLEDEDHSRFTDFNCRNCTNGTNKDNQQENADEIINGRLFGGLKKVTKGLDIVKQMGECVVNKANYALGKLNMITDSVHRNEQDEFALPEG